MNLCKANNILDWNNKLEIFLLTHTSAFVRALTIYSNDDKSSAQKEKSAEFHLKQILK